MNFLNFDLSQNPLLRNIFYINGKYYPYYKYFVQGIWLSLCAFIGFNIFKIKGKRQKNQNEINLVFLVIIGIILFNLLFEARSRYLISFLPFYAMAAARGTEIVGIIGNQLQKRLHSSKHYAKLFTL